MDGLQKFKDDSDINQKRNKMPSPVANRPKVTKEDIANGYVTRYFAKFISGNKVIEIDEKQFEKFQGDTYHKTLQLKWIIGGNDLDVVSSDGQVIYGTKHQNTAIANFYDKKMPGVKQLLRDPLEFFVGTKVTT